MSALPLFQESAFMLSLHSAFAAQANPTAAQAQAWSTFIQLGLPGLRDEQWKYTQLHRLYSQSFSAHQLTPSVTAPDGVKVMQVAIPRDDTTQPFIALSQALNSHELLIEVPDGVTITQPLMLEFATAGTQPALIASRVVVKLGRNSQLTLIERHSSANDISHANILATNINLDENARLVHCCLQVENQSSFQLSTTNVVVSKHAQYFNHHFNLGGSVGRADINVKLSGADAYTELNGLQFATGNQVHDTHSRIEHCVPRARSSETYHGIADQRGQVVFNGKVMVHKHAIGTDAQQSSRNLLLSPKAEIDTKPELEIYADDVKCAHGATVGQLDNTALFYLRSRGIGEQQARGILTMAFADSVINRVPVAAVRDELTALVHARFGANVEVAS